MCKPCILPACAARRTSLKGNVPGQPSHTLTENQQPTLPQPRHACLLQVQPTECGASRGVLQPQNRPTQHGIDKRKINTIGITQTSHKQQPRLAGASHVTNHGTAKMFQHSAATVPDKLGAAQQACSVLPCDNKYHALTIQGAPNMPWC